MKKYLKKIAIVLFWLFLWHLLALHVDNSILLATPFQVFYALLTLLKETVFWQTILMSSIRIAVGFFLSLVTALILAFLSAVIPLIEDILKPFMNFLKSVPIASIAVLFLIWWGSSALSIVISFLVALPNIYINTLEGWKNTDKQLLEMAEIFQISVWDKFLSIYRPALQPFWYSALKFSVGMCWKSGVAAEIIGTPKWSVGERIYLSKISLDTAGIFAWTAVVILFSFLFEKSIMRIADLFFAWEPSYNRNMKKNPILSFKKKIGEKKQGQKKRENKAKKNNVLKSPDLETIKCQGVCKAYHNKTIIHNFSAVYQTGKVYYLTSPSGSGKTTLLRLLCGLEKADKGKIERPKNCSMVFQEDRLCLHYSAIRNVNMVTKDSKKARNALLQLLEQTDLDKPCSQLSGGMKRRVALVRAMEASSNYILLDEPFTGMDEATRKKAESYIQERQKGRTIIIATHISRNKI